MPAHFLHLCLLLLSWGRVDLLRQRTICWKALNIYCLALCRKKKTFVESKFCSISCHMNATHYKYLMEITITCWVRYHWQDYNWQKSWLCLQRSRILASIRISLISLSCFILGPHSTVLKSQYQMHGLGLTNSGAWGTHNNVDQTRAFLVGNMPLSPLFPWSILEPLAFKLEFVEAQRTAKDG